MQTLRAKVQSVHAQVQSIHAQPRATIFMTSQSSSRGIILSEQEIANED
jgi:hypothetical protein